MFKLKRDRRREHAKSIGLGYYKDNGVSVRHSEIDLAAPKVIKLITMNSMKITPEEAKLVLRSRYADGNAEKAAELFRFYQEANDGILLDVQDAPAPATDSVSLPASTGKQSSTSTATQASSSARTITDSELSLPPLLPMLGAENYNGITCYLDALLFAMYARLETFEPILYKVYDDGPLRSLSTLLRLWVNLLRAGKLITSDITGQLRVALAENGWEEALSDCQQDASEAFVFIAEKLSMPLLTLKLNIAHGGKEAAADDHKLVNERLLHVPVLGDPSDPPISLLACLEEYFSNSVVVRREIERRQSVSLASNKAQATHIESVELDGRVTRSGTIDVRPEYLNALAQKNSLHHSSNPGNVVASLRAYSLNSSESAVSVTSTSSMPTTPSTPITPTISVISATQRDRRRSSVRSKNEIPLPAWVFLQLLPFYTDAAPQSSSAEHFARKRPVLAICLKRYTWSKSGSAVRNDRKVLIPEVIELPHFVADDPDSEADNIYGNFRLVLEAAVCHRGTSVYSGHYISLVRDSVFRRRQQLMQHLQVDSYSGPDDSSSTTSALAGDNWLKFDDLGTPRISSTSLREAMETEVPYMLFYRMVHIDEPIELEQVTSLESNDNNGLGPSSTRTSVFSSQSVPTSFTGSSEEDNVEEDTLRDFRFESGGEEVPSVRESPDNSLKPSITKRWRDRSMNRKQSTKSMPGSVEKMKDDLPAPEHHHRHHHRRRLHRLHHHTNAGAEKTEGDDGFDEEEKCIIS